MQNELFEEDNVLRIDHKRECYETSWIDIILVKIRFFNYLEWEMNNS